MLKVWCTHISNWGQIWVHGVWKALSLSMLSANSQIIRTSGSIKKPCTTTTAAQHECGNSTKSIHQAEPPAMQRTMHKLGLHWPLVTPVSHWYVSKDDRQCWLEAKWWPSLMQSWLRWLHVHWCHRCLGGLEVAVAGVVPMPTQLRIHCLLAWPCTTIHCHAPDQNNQEDPACITIANFNIHAMTEAFGTINMPAIRSLNGLWKSTLQGQHQYS